MNKYDTINIMQSKYDDYMQSIKQKYTTISNPAKYGS